MMLKYGYFCKATFVKNRKDEYQCPVQISFDFFSIFVAYPALLTVHGIPHVLPSNGHLVLLCSVKQMPGFTLELAAFPQLK